VREWRIDVPARFAADLGLDNVMFEAADPAVFSWYVKTYGPEVNLFVDHPPERTVAKGRSEPVTRCRNRGECPP
jgi:phosphosulfolactate synthase (CoM biosynthesis protein A)